MHMRVRILGPLEVTVDGEAVEVAGARLRALMIRLALGAGRIVTVESLSSALWPDDRPAERAHALQSLASRLRRALPGGSALRCTPGGYCFDIPPDAVDALLFERLARDGRRLLRQGQPDAASRQLREALGLWRGQPLADVADAPFAAGTAARLEELRLGAIEDRVELDLQTSRELSHLVAELEELVAVHPLRDRLRGLLVKALRAEGRTGEALQAYEDFRQLLAKQLGADPGPELQEVHLAMLRGERAAEPPHRPTRGNLRAPLTSFVGRAEQHGQIVQQLTDARLVTLVGPGGVGKTRLATAVAADLAGQLPGGVWLVELAPLTEAAEVVRAMSNVLGLRTFGLLDGPGAPRDPVSQLVDALFGAEALIVVDCCEHLLDAVAGLVEELLGRCPRLRVLATSREPLGVLGEALRPVRPLGVPEDGSTTTQIAGSPSVRLFVDRVVAVRPDFRLTDDTIDLVAEACRRLDGLPLAIELAAARLRSLSVEQLAERLDDRFRVLTGGSRTALPRHQTLRAVVAWSWQLLKEPERLLAERLAVFPGTYNLAAAQAVCAGDGIEPDALVDLLAALVDKSLVQLVEAPSPRYRMLDTIREFGLEKLAETGGITRLRAAYVHHFLDVAESAEVHLRGSGQLHWIAELRRERTSLLTALRLATEAGDADTAVRLGAALGFFWTIQGNPGDAAGWLRLALEIPGDAPPPARTTATAFYLFNAVLSAGQISAVIAADAAGGGPDAAAGPPQHPFSAFVDAVLALLNHDTASGLAAIDQEVQHGDPWVRGMLWLMRSFLQGNSGDVEGASHTLGAAVAAFREAGERWGLAMSHTVRSEACALLGDFDGAIDALEEAIRLLQELDPADRAVIQRALLANARIQQGDVERGRAELLDMVRPGAGSASGRYLVPARIALGNLARNEDDLEEASQQYDAAGADLELVPFSAPLFRAMLGTAKAHLAVARQQPAEAGRCLSEALVLAVGAPDMPVAALVSVGVAGLLAATGDRRGAAEVLGAAHALRGAPDAYNPDVARIAEELRTGLGPQAYVDAYTHGRGLGRVEALALVQGHLPASRGAAAGGGTN
jgi:predicted ATPase/DNA-binding SARP family transcriptional activator